MSVRECLQPECRPASGPIEQQIEPRDKDLGGFSVRRVLPASARKRVGPFIFFDHLGPSRFAAGRGVDVRPHPHIGLSTLTYLFSGRILHRDSLGSVQPIEPGAVNWMTAGRGIVHSERTPGEERSAGSELHGIQSWVALPDGREEIEPSFTHHEAGSLPVVTRPGATLTLVAGEAFGERAPVRTYSPLFYAHVEVEAGARVPLPSDPSERALYVVDGEVDVAGARQAERRMLVLARGADPPILAVTPSRLMLLGGAPLGSDRILWWNFASSSRERLEAAQRDWREGRFGGVPGETEFIPLPDA